MMANNPSGITPPSDPSTQDRRSRSSRENLALVPAASIVLERNRPSRRHHLDALGFATRLAKIIVTCECHVSCMFEPC